MRSADKPTTPDIAEIVDPLTRRSLLARSAGVTLSVTALGGLLSACGGGSSSSSPKTTSAKPPSVPTGTLNVALPLDPITLDPARAVEFGDLPIVSNVYEGLTRVDPKTSEVAPCLATRWETSDDQTEWIFHLVDGVTFHDGEPFDASAIKKTFEYYVSQTDAFGYALMPQFRQIDDSDPLKIRFVLKTPFGDMLRNQTVVRMMSPKLVAKGKDAIGKAMVGTGPYRLVKAVQGTEVALGAFEDYRGPGPYFEQLVFPVIGDTSAQVTAVKTGKIDILTRVPPNQVGPLSADGNLHLESRVCWGSTYLMFQGLSKTTADVRVRQAVGYAVDIPAIIKSIVLDQGVLAKSVLPDGVYGYQVPSTVYSHDPNRAKELLTQVGTFGSQPIKMAISLSASGNPQAVGDAVTAQLNESGFKATVDVVDEVVISNDQLGDAPKYDLYYTEFYWPTGGPVILTTGIFQAFTHFSPPEYEKLLAVVNSTPDGPERLNALAEIQELIAREAPVIPLWQQKITDALRANIRGYVPTKDGLLNSYQTTYRAG